MSLESNYTARLTIHRPEGDLALDIEHWEGGQLDSEETKHRNPVTRVTTARGGLSTRDNITLHREADAATWAVKSKLEDSARADDPCTAVRQMIGPRGESIGSPESITGLVKAVKFPDYDLSGNDVGMIDIEVSTDEVAA